MEEDQLTSTAEAARKRREMRRRRILENSDNRMKRLMGQPEDLSGQFDGLKVPVIYPLGDNVMSWVDSV